MLLLEQQQQQLELWEVAELEEVWDACLLSAAELLTQHGAGSVFGRVLAARDGWLSQAAARRSSAQWPPQGSILQPGNLSKAVGSPVLFRRFLETSGQV